MRLNQLTAILVLSVAASAQATVPMGTILPVNLLSSLNSSRMRASQQVKAQIMQDVPVRPGFVIHAGTKVLGEVVTTSSTTGSGASLSLCFDRLQLQGAPIHITTDLRAIASFMTVYDAQLPLNGPDRGTSEASWTTVQVGGDVVYRGGGPVTSWSGTVGKPVPGGVLVKVTSRPGSPRRGPLDGADRLQALWVFSSDACGVYGLADVMIRHAGRIVAVGEIILSSSRPELKLSRGTGLLLRVVAP